VAMIAVIHAFEVDLKTAVIETSDFEHSEEIDVQVAVTREPEFQELDSYPQKARDNPIFDCFTACRNAVHSNNKQNYSESNKLQAYRK